MLNDNFNKFIPINRGRISDLYPWNNKLIDFFFLFVPDFLLIFFKKDILVKIKKFFNTKFVFFLDSGTSAILVSLRAFGVKYGDEVLVSCLICPNVIDAIIASGAVPIFVSTNFDFQLDINDLRSKIGENSRCIIISNIYGLVENLKVVKDISLKNNLLLINDLAQSFVSLEGEEIKREHLGDINIYSLGPQKHLSSLCGGIITTQSSSIASNIIKILPSKRVSYFKLWSYLISIIKYRTKFLMTRFSYIFNIKEHPIWLKEKYSASDYACPSLVIPLLLPLGQIISFYFKLRLSKRYFYKLKNNIIFLNKELSFLNKININHNTSNYNLLYYTLRTAGCDRHYLGSYLSQNGFLCTWNYYPVTYYMAYSDYKKGLILNESWRQVASIPFRNLSSKRLQKLVGLIRSYYEE